MARGEWTRERKSKDGRDSFIMDGAGGRHSESGGVPAGFEINERHRGAILSGTRINAIMVNF